jgi:tetratricopeptide (TPR) repeat protein
MDDSHGGGDIRRVPALVCRASFFILYPFAFILPFLSGCGPLGKGDNSAFSPVSLVQVPERNVEVRLAKGGFGSAGGLTNHGITHAQNGRWNEAVETWKQALAADPDCHAAHFNLGQAYAIQGMHAWAYTAMRRAAELDDNPLYRDGLRLVEVAMQTPQVRQNVGWDKRSAGPPQ